MSGLVTESSAPDQCTLYIIIKFYNYTYDILNSECSLALNQHGTDFSLRPDPTWPGLNYIVISGSALLQYF